MIIDKDEVFGLSLSCYTKSPSGRVHFSFAFLLKGGFYDKQKTIHLLYPNINLT